MSGNNPRKFKDRIALLAQKEAEGTAQFQEVMREVAEVKKPGCLDGPSPTGSGLNIPKHLNPMVLNQNAHYRIHGGSLPNVNQMVASGHSNNSGVHNTGYQGFVQCGGAPEYSSILSLKQTYASQVPERSRTTSMGSPGSGGGGAIRNRSGDRRWDTSPYGGERASPAGNSVHTGSPYYSASLSPYLSPPPPENRWRRTSSDSALYQSAAGGAVSPVPGSSATGVGGHGIMMGARSPSQHNDGAGSETGSPSSITNEEEPGLNGFGDGGSCKSPKSPCSPLSPMTPPNSCSPTYHYVPPELESGFQNFRLEAAPSSPAVNTATSPAQLQHQSSNETRQNVQNVHSVPQQESKQLSPLHLPSLPTSLHTYHHDNHYQQNQEIPTPNTDPASPMTPGMLPGFLITDWDNAGYNKQETWNNVQLKQENRTDTDNPLWNLANCKDNDAQFVENLREGLEPIDEQLLATLTGQTSFVDPAVEEQFKINY